MLPRALHYIDAVARAGSVRKAAARLNVAASAVNRQLIELEEEFGVALFERRPRGMRATAAGELLLAHIRRQRADGELVRQQMEELRGVRRGVVRIGAVEAAARGLLAQVLLEFRASHPRVAFCVSVGGTTRLVAELVSEAADLALLFNAPAAAEMQTLAECVAPLHAVMRPDHPLARRATLRLAECLAYPIALSAQDLGGRALIDAAMTGASARLEPAMEADSFEVMAQFACGCEGIFFQIAVGVAPEVMRGNLVAVPLVDRDLAGGRLSLMMRRGRTLHPAAARLSERLAHLVRCCAGSRTGGASSFDLG